MSYEGQIDKNGWNLRLLKAHRHVVCHDAAERRYVHTSDVEEEVHLERRKLDGAYRHFLRTYRCEHSGDHVEQEHEGCEWTIP